MKEFRKMILDTEELKKYFKYEDGDLVWKVDRRPGIKAGDIAGGVANTGYVRIKFKGKMYLVHRLIFLMYHGYLPRCIDHIDGNKLNNRIENLRECSHSQNIANSKKSKSNASGVKNVCWDKVRGKWMAVIMVNGRNKYFGRYDDIEEAAIVVKRERERLFGEFARCE